MRVSLAKMSDVPLNEQLAEQIVYYIATGRLRQNDHLPSVRTMARQLGIHYNTVSKAYQELVTRGWLQRQHGARLKVGIAVSNNFDLKSADAGLDEIINSAIDRARQAGYSLHTLQERVVHRLFEERPDHILVVEQEPELRSILRAEVFSALCKPTQSCSLEDIKKSPELAVGAQIVTPEYSIQALRPLMPSKRPCIPLIFSAADEHVAMVRELTRPSIIGIASISRIVLRTARAVLAPAVRRRHALMEFQVFNGRMRDLRACDILFCDTTVLPIVRSKNKIAYRLIESRALRDIAASFASYD
jgi:GntR family transcriptional regulator